MGFFFTVFYQPFYNLLVWLYVVMPVASIGIPIIVTTLLIKGALFPLTFRSLKSQKEMQEIQPMIKEIREKYKDDKVRTLRVLFCNWENCICASTKFKGGHCVRHFLGIDVMGWLKTCVFWNNYLEFPAGRSGLRGQLV